MMAVLCGLIFLMVMPSIVFVKGWQSLGMVLILVTEAPQVEQIKLISSQMKEGIPS